MFLNVCAWIVVVLAVVAVLAGPYLIGKPREPMGAGGYLFQALFSAANIAIAGRVLGWW